MKMVRNFEIEILAMSIIVMHFAFAHPARAQKPVTVYYQKTITSLGGMIKLECPELCNEKRTYMFESTDIQINLPNVPVQPEQMMAYVEWTYLETNEKQKTILPYMAFKADQSTALALQISSNSRHIIEPCPNITTPMIILEGQFADNTKADVYATITIKPMDLNSE